MNLSQVTTLLKSRGFTLIELALTIAVAIILSLVGIQSYNGMIESGDASTVQSVQASLQTTITQASTRLEVTPLALSSGTGAFNGNNVVNACRPSLPSEATLTWQSGGNYQLSLSRRNRVATFTLTSSGDVVIQSISGFQQYTVLNGVIKKI